MKVGDLLKRRAERWVHHELSGVWMVVDVKGPANIRIPGLAMISLVCPDGTIKHISVEYAEYSYMVIT